MEDQLQELQEFYCWIQADCWCSLFFRWYQNCRLFLYSLVSNQFSSVQFPSSSLIPWITSLISCLLLSSSYSFPQTSCFLSRKLVKPCPFMPLKLKGSSVIFIFASAPTYCVNQWQEIIWNNCSLEQTLFLYKNAIFSISEHYVYVLKSSFLHSLATPSLNTTVSTALKNTTLKLYLLLTEKCHNLEAFYSFNSCVSANMLTHHGLKWLQVSCTQQPVGEEISILLKRWWEFSTESSNKYQCCSLSVVWTHWTSDYWRNPGLYHPLMGGKTDTVFISEVQKSKVHRLPLNTEQSSIQVRDIHRRPGSVLRAATLSLAVRLLALSTNLNKNEITVYCMVIFLFVAALNMNSEPY